MHIDPIYKLSCHCHIVQFCLLSVGGSMTFITIPLKAMNCNLSYIHFLIIKHSLFGILMDGKGRSCVSTFFLSYPSFEP